MKQCSKCKNILKEENFSLDKKMKNGYHSWCRKCVSKGTKKWLEKYKLEHGETHSNKWARENHKKCAKNQNNWYHKNHDKAKKQSLCRRKTYVLLKQRGIDNQPCEVCGKKAIKHHNDYNNPYDIDWLCPYHHIQLHKLLKLPEFKNVNIL